MNNKKFYADVASPNPSINWLGLSEVRRIEKINQAIKKNKNFTEELIIVSAKGNGEIIVKMINQLSPSVRGMLLLDFEEFIKKEIDVGLTVWAEALGDKNSLRKLRGIEVKIS